MSKLYFAIAGSIVGVLLLALAVRLLLYHYKSWFRNSSKRSSETGSSDPSTLEWNRGGGEGRRSSSSAPGHPLFGQQHKGGRQFTLEELAQATRQFSDNSIIGHGSFGPVYKGLLYDTIVAIKRRYGSPQDHFVAEVAYLSEIRHRNLVTLLGYCQESGYQMLVFEYVPNGSMFNHLFDAGFEPPTKLEFKQRLSIAIGAAKGLSHLHSLSPHLQHKNFKSTNVLVDENFIVKVSDAGIANLLEKVEEEAGPSHHQSGGLINAFRDPEVESSGSFNEESDVYSFGVFLLELITGHQAQQIQSLGSNEGLIQWVASRLSRDEFVDRRIVGSFTTDGMRDMIKLMLKCMSFPGKGRPKMEMVVAELERIREEEMALTTVMGESTTTIIKGSELFT
ncbi:Probable serine/threonine-protein kinase PBL22 [Linum grandiflorum]